MSLICVTHFNSKAIPTINTHYSCHTKATELVLEIIWGLYHATLHHWLLIASGVDTQTHTHTQVTDKINF